MTPLRCPKCGKPLSPVETALECRACDDGAYYEPTLSGRLRMVPSPYPGMPAADPDEDRMVATVAERWTPDMARSSIRGAKR